MRKQSPQPGGNCLEEPGFLSIQEKLCEANRNDFLDGLGVDLGLADLGCEGD